MLAASNTGMLTYTFLLWLLLSLREKNHLGVYKGGVIKIFYNQQDFKELYEENFDATRTMHVRENLSYT